MAEKAKKPVKRVRFKLPDDDSPGAGTRAGAGGDSAAAAAPAPQREPSSSPPRSPSPPEPFTYDFGEGSSGGGDGAAAAAPAPRREPSSSPPRSPSPPEPFTYDPDEGSSGGGAALPGRSYFPSPLPPPSFGDEASDDEEPGEFKRRNGWGSLFMSDPQVLSMYSSDPQNLPRYIGRQDCEPLSTQEFFSRHHNWRRLLHGKKTYLRPPNNNRVAKYKYDDRVFVTPKPLALAVQCQAPLLHMFHLSAGIPTIQQKYKILSEYYVFFRVMRNDGSQFYRAFLFSYLENLGKMQGSQAEVTRLRECVARSRENFCRLKWNNAYFSNPEAFFSSVVSEFEHLVNSAANGLNSDDLYVMSLEDISSSRILCLLRLLTEVHIRTHEVDYNRVLSQKNALLFCKESVRPFGAGTGTVQIMALSQALGIPVHLAIVDGAMKDGTVQVQCLDFVPQSESGVSRTSGPLSSIGQYYLSSATDKHPVLPAGNLFLSDRMPLVTIMMTITKDIAILYRK